MAGNGFLWTIYFLYIDKHFLLLLLLKPFPSSCRRCFITHIVRRRMCLKIRIPFFTHRLKRELSSIKKLKISSLVSFRSDLFACNFKRKISHVPTFFSLAAAVLSGNFSPIKSSTYIYLHVYIHIYANIFDHRQLRIFFRNFRRIKRNRKKKNQVLSIEILYPQM